MIWNLSRPKPALPSSYFWTWDHSTNWMLDDPGIINSGCANKYTKRPETFVEDYKKLIDFSAGLGIKGILIWGFIRDSHSGIDYSKRVADYAASKGVAIMPGCRSHKEKWPKDDPDFFRFQAMSYVPAVEAIKDRLKDNLVTWATYTGFLPETGKHHDGMPSMQCERPALIDHVAYDAICQWTLTGMVKRESLPLTAYLDDGAPEAAFDNPNWPEDNLREFGRKTLGQVLLNEDEGEAYAEYLAHWDGGVLSDAQKKDIAGRASYLWDLVSREGGQDNIERWRFWHWLHTMAAGRVEQHTVSFY